VLGEEYLVSPTFTTLPHRADFQRLFDTSQHPVFSRKIETLLITLGEINEYHARHNSYFIQYMRDPDERLAAQEMAWGAYATFRTQKESCMPLACTPDLLDPALKNLSHLKRVEVSLAKCPFPENDERTELLRQIWNIPSTRLLPRVATTERFTNLLSALASSPSTVMELSHDRLPFEFFAQKAMVISLISTTFLPLKSLSLVLDYSDMPYNLHAPQSFQNLSHCLRSAAGLQKLYLSFQGRKKVDISPLLDSFSEQTFSFAELQRIKFEGVSCAENELVTFLLGHKSSLKEVQLGGVGIKAPHQKANGGIYLKEGTWKGIFEKVGAGMDLETFVMQGDMVEMEGGKHFVLEELEPVESLRTFVRD
jgi:hypothetical protein